MKMDNKVIALVNGKEITERDLAATVSRFPRERQSYFNSEEGRNQIVNQMISFELFYNYAKETGMENDQEYLMQLENAKREILTQHAINKELSNVTVTNEEIKNFYNENMSQFIQPESVSARHILVDNIDDATKIKKEIEAGLSFEEAANKYSSCPSKEQGGDLGSFTKGRMVPEFENAAFELAVGEVSEPVQTQFGYHLIKVENKEDANIKPVEEAAQFIGNQIYQQKQAAMYTEIVGQLSQKYPVEVK
jgi:peptidyl-prolyl cis-trans isomerase C